MNQQTKTSPASEESPESSANIDSVTDHVVESASGATAKQPPVTESAGEAAAPGASGDTPPSVPSHDESKSSLAPPKKSSSAMPPKVHAGAANRLRPSARPAGEGTEHNQSHAPPRPAGVAPVSQRLSSAPPRKSTPPPGHGAWARAGVSAPAAPHAPNQPRATGGSGARPSVPPPSQPPPPPSARPGMRRLTPPPPPLRSHTPPPVVETLELDASEVSPIVNENRRPVPAHNSAVPPHAGEGHVGKMSGPPRAPLKHRVPDSGVPAASEPAVDKTSAPPSVRSTPPPRPHRSSVSPNASSTASQPAVATQDHTHSVDAALPSELRKQNEPAESQSHDAVNPASAGKTETQGEAASVGKTETQGEVASAGKTETQGDVTSAGKTETQGDVTSAGKTETQGEVASAGKTETQGEVTSAGKTETQGEAASAGKAESPSATVSADQADSPLETPAIEAPAHLREETAADPGGTHEPSTSASVADPEEEIRTTLKSVVIRQVGRGAAGAADSTDDSLEARTRATIPSARRRAQVPLLSGSLSPDNRAARSLLLAAAGVVVGLLVIVAWVKKSSHSRARMQPSVELRSAEPTQPSAEIRAEPSAVNPPPAEPSAEVGSPAPAASASEAATDDSSGTAEDEVHIKVVVKPDGTQFYSKGKLVGVTPFVLSQPRGEKRAYEVVKPGYASRRVIVTGKEKLIGFPMVTDVPHPDSL